MKSPFYSLSACKFGTRLVSAGSMLIAAAASAVVSGRGQASGFVAPRVGDDSG